MLQALRCYMQKTPFCPTEQNVDWVVFFREAWMQSVTLPLVEFLPVFQEKVPQPVFQVAEKQMRKLSVNNMQILFAQQNMTRCLDQAEIPYVILKGTASAAYWPNPELRQQGDVDFIVPKDQLEQAALQLEAAGMTREQAANDHHIGFRCNKIQLEMHNRLSGAPRGQRGEPVKRYMADLYSLRQTLPEDGTAVPADVHQAVILLLHTQHHLIEQGIGLRHVLDWAAFVQKTMDAPFWTQQVLPLLQELKLLRFAAALTRMSADWFQIGCPQWAQEIPRALSDALMEDVLAGGNFGRKNTARSRSSNMLPSWEYRDQRDGKMKMLYKTLKRATIVQNPKLENQPVRRFFVMTGKVLRYVGLRCVGKRPSLMKAASYVDDRRSLYQQLEIYE